MLILLFMTAALAATPTTSSKSQAKSLIISVTKVIGELQDRHITTREVRINTLAEQLLPQVLGSSDGPRAFSLPKEEDERFAQEVERVLFEWAAFLEAKSFNAEPSHNQTEISRYTKKLGETARAAPVWAALEVADDELRGLVERKLYARDYEKLKLDSLTAVVTDADALSYFQKNRLRFGTLPFENFKDNIKTLLVKQGTETRFREWKDVLRRKYRIKNYLR